MLPIHTVLHPTDFEEHPDEALHLAEVLARDFTMPIWSCCTWPRRRGSSSPRGMLPAVEDPKEYCENKLDNMKIDVVPNDRVHWRVEEGEPAEEIVHTAQMVHADLIVMGMHGRRGLPRFFKGSVAEKVVREAPCPVLTVKRAHASRRSRVARGCGSDCPVTAEEDAMLLVHTILHPTDFSDQAGHAFRMACGLAKDFHAQLVLLHVVRHPALLGYEFLGYEEHPQELVEKLWSLPVPVELGPACRRLEEGNPAEEILRVAELAHADLIVMGRNEPHGLNRLLSASVADKVVRQAACPVLTVRLPIDGR